jgi:F0F1-type ATP synthase assembly protein I
MKTKIKEKLERSLMAGAIIGVLGFFISIPLIIETGNLWFLILPILLGLMTALMAYIDCGGYE